MRGQTSSALRPSATAATTSRSGTTSSRSSSDSRKTSLSSTRTTVMGSPAMPSAPPSNAGLQHYRKGHWESIGLFGREQERVVGLAAFVHLDLQLGMRVPKRLDELLDALGLLAGEDGQNVGRLPEQSLDHVAANRLESRTGRYGLLVHEAQELALLDREPAQARRPRRARHRAGTHARGRLLHLGRVLLPRAAPFERDHGAQPRLQRARGHDVHGLPAGSRSLLGGEDDVLVVWKDDDLLRRYRLDRGHDVGRRGIHRLAALDAVGAEALEQALRPRSRAHGDHARARLLACQALLAVESLRMHVL